MNVLAVVWFAAAIGGAVAAGIALLAPRARRAAFLAAGMGFAIAGVLGILSIGIVFIGLAAICFTQAESRGVARSPDGPPPPRFPRADTLPKPTPD